MLTQLNSQPFQIFQLIFQQKQPFHLILQEKQPFHLILQQKQPFHLFKLFTIRPYPVRIMHPCAIVAVLHNFVGDVSKLYVDLHLTGHLGGHCLANPSVRYPHIISDVLYQFPDVVS